MTIGVNKAGADWLYIKKWLAEQIDQLHRQMESPLSVEEYHQIRGSILLARELIEQVEPVKMPEIQEDTYGISDAEEGITQ